MGFRFFKQINIGKYLRLNLSSSGISASVGKKGASVTFGKNGTYLNLSPVAAGITGTGLSYRQRLGKGYKELTKKVTKKEEKEDFTLIENDVRMYKDCQTICTKDQYQNYIDSTNDEEKEKLQKVISGDKETIEEQIAEFIKNSKSDYDTSFNYELDNDILYMDVDLPEIENIDQVYVYANAKKEIITKEKPQSEIKKDYAKIVCSIPLYLANHFFNFAPSASQIVMSGYTQVRNNDGDIVNKYLFSVKFLREVFEQTDFSKVEDPYKFLCQFENRINLSSINNFKEIKPFSKEEKTLMPTVDQNLTDAIDALEALGYKKSDINKIVPQLKEEPFDNASDYITKGLKLLKSQQ